MTESSAGRGATIGLAAAVLAQAGLLVSGVIAARGLGPTDRGLLALVTLVPVLAWQVGSLGLPLSITYVAARDRSALRAVTSFCSRTGALQMLALVPVAAAVLVPIAAGHGPQVLASALVALAAIPAHLVHQYGLAILRAAGRLIASYVVLVAPVLLWAAALGALALFGALTLLGATVAYAGTYGLAALIAARVAHTSLPVDSAGDGGLPGVSWMVGFGLRGMLGSAPVVQTFRVDQAIVGLLLAPASLGLYVVATGLTNLPRFIATTIGLAAYPAVARERDGRAAHTTVWRYFWLALAAYGPVALLLWALAPWLVPFFFGASFEGAVPITRVLLLASGLGSAQRLLIDGARGIGKPGLGSLSELALLVTLAGATAVLLPRAGLEGVAWAVVIASGVGFATVLGGVLMARARRPGATGPGAEE